MTTKACAGCGLVLPLERFSKVNGRRKSRCKDCLREENRVDRARYRARLKADGQLSNATARGSEPDPLNFSRLVCEHVSVYVGRAIRRWESTTEKEAPPYLGALKQVADGFVHEHPKRKCIECGQELPKGSTAQRKFCGECRKVRAYEARRRQKLRQRRAALLREPQALIMGARRDMAQLLRMHGLTWQEISDRMGLSGTGAAYNLAHYDTFLPYSREKNRRRRAQLRE